MKGSVPISFHMTSWADPRVLDALECEPRQPKTGRSGRRSRQPVGFPPFWFLGARWLSPPNSKSAVMHRTVHGRNGVLEDALPLAEDQVGAIIMLRRSLAFGER